ncbi:MAG: HupE/UreJ family protein [Armatimonadetes bacterium]|nr:HupE/UreJ family protein [Armatimonadota bacterium]
MKRWLIGLLFLGVASFAAAHDPNLSGIRVIIWPNRTVVSVLTHISKLAKISGPVTESNMNQLVADRLKLVLDGEDFIAAKPIHTLDTENDILTYQATVLSSAKTVEMLSRIYPDDPESRTLVSIVRDGANTDEVLLDANNPSWTKSGGELSILEVVRRFFTLGIHHILSGPDHILFVLGIVLIGSTFRKLFKVVTAFTIAHSITLTLAALKVATPPSRIVEPLIALSIVAIAVENIRLRQISERPVRDYRVPTVFAFGLVHGFGFAGALSDAGLTGSTLVGGLVTFNLGVEAGQALILVATVPIATWLISKKPDAWSLTNLWGSIAIGLAGAWWFFERLSG